MIKWLIKETGELNLAWLAMVLPLLSLGFWIPGVILLVPLQFFLPEYICEMAMVIVLVVWLVFVVALWLRGIQVARRTKVRGVSPKVFHILQGLSLVWMGANLFVRQGEWVDFLRWVVCMDVALAVFYVSYFVLALFTLTKIPWHALTGFAIVILSLVCATLHNPFKNLL